MGHRTEDSSGSRASDRESVSPIWMVAGALLLLFLLTACAGESRLIRPPAVAPAAEFALRSEAAEPDGVAATIQQLIVFNGPGSWIRDADWDEYAIEIRNDSATPLRVTAIGLASAKLLSAHTTSREELVSASLVNLESLKAAGTIVALGAVAAVGGVAVAGAATAAAYASLGGGSAAGASAAIAVMPVLAIVGTGALVYHVQTGRAADRAAIDYELERRGLRLPLVVPPHGKAQGSAFFALTPGPRALTITYESAGRVGEMRVDLARFADLHLARGER